MEKLSDFLSNGLDVEHDACRDKQGNRHRHERQGHSSDSKYSKQFAFEVKKKQKRVHLLAIRRSEDRWVENSSFKEGPLDVLLIHEKIWIRVVTED